MGVVGIIDARDVHDDVARLERQTPNGYAPYGVAAYFVGECTLVCPDCATDEERESADVVFGDSEWDYPGYTCEDCGRWIDVTLLVYDSGPGRELLEDGSDVHWI